MPSLNEYVQIMIKCKHTHKKSSFERTNAGGINRSVFSLARFFNIFVSVSMGSSGHLTEYGEREKYISFLASVDDSKHLLV